MFVGVYARVSKEEQSVSQQVEQGRAFAERRGDVPLVFVDEGVSGSVSSRLGWDKLLDKAKVGGVGCIWVQRIDRITRDSAYAIDFWKLLQTLDIKLISHYEGEFNPHDGDDYFRFALSALLADREKMVLIKRTKDGIARARREGKKIGGGKKGRKWKK